MPVRSSAPARGSASPSALASADAQGTPSLLTAGDCPLSHLQVEPGHSGGGLGHATVAITFTNASPDECQLAGYPEVFGVTTTGAKAELRHDTTLPPPVGAVMLQPGTKVEALVSGLDMPQGQATCPAPYASWVIQLPFQSTSVTISGYLPYLGANFPSCVPAVVSGFGPPGSFNGLDGVQSGVQGCTPRDLRLGAPPGTAVLTYAEGGTTQVNLSVTNSGPACTAYGYPSLALYGPSGVLPPPVAHGHTTTGDQPPGEVFLQSSQSASFVLDFTSRTGQGPCARLTGLGLAGTARRLTLAGTNGTPDVCGTIHESAIFPPAY